MPIILTAILAVLLAAAVAIDIRSHRLPDAITLPLVTIGLAANLTIGWSVLPLYIAGAIIGFVSLWALAALYHRVTNRAGLGLGDAKLLAAAGAWMGPLALAPVIFLGSLMALGYVGVLRLAGARVSSQTIVPFGPFLSVGFLVVWSAHLAGYI